MNTQTFIRPFRICLRCQYSTSATTTTTLPPLLRRIRNELKVAMKTKDRTRLDVIRGLISEMDNAAKTAIPITTDSQMLSLLRKRVTSSQAAIIEFEEAQRDDLREKETAQIAVLEDFIKGSGVISEEAVTTAIQQLIGNMRTEDKKVDKGRVMKALVGPGGTLEGQTVDRKDIARLVDGML